LLPIAQAGVNNPRFTNIAPHFRNASLKPAIQPRTHVAPAAGTYHMKVTFFEAVATGTMHITRN